MRTTCIHLYLEGFETTKNFVQFLKSSVFGAKKVLNRALFYAVSARTTSTAVTFKNLYLKC